MVREDIAYCKGKTEKRKAGNIIVVLLLAASFVLSPLTQMNLYAGSVPKYTAKATDENVLAVLKKYNPTGYFFVKYARDYNYEDPTMWYEDGDSIIDNLNDTVHEACHGYTGDISSLSYVDGDEIETFGFRVAPDTDMYESFDIGYMVWSNEMANDIPAELRDRWETYIGDDSGSSVANQYGVYGMLDEFNAYAWSLYTDLCSYRYIKDTSDKKTALKWLKTNAPTNIDAYYEYKLWFHMYLKHVKDNYPDLYASIAENEEFINVYRAIDEIFSDYIRQYKELTGDSGNVKYRKAVMKVIKDKKYKEIRKLLKGKKIDTSKYVWTGLMDWTSIRSITFDDSGIRISWRITEDADGYELYRRSGNGEYGLIKDVAKDPGETSLNYVYTDKGIGKGGTFTYYVIPYKNNPDGTRSYGEKSIERQKTVMAKVKLLSAEYKSGSINVKWKKYKEKGASCFEIKCEVEKQVKSYTKEDGTEVETTSSSTVSEYCEDINATSYLYTPSMGEGEYKLSMRAIFKKDGKTIYSPWSDTIAVQVKK